MIINKVLWLDKNRHLTDQVLSYISDDNIIIDFCLNIEDTVLGINNHSYRLIILNQSHCKNWDFTITSIRQKSKVPIIVLSEKRNTADMITALNIGADDYIVTAESNALEISLRIKAILRRAYEYAECVDLSHNRLMNFGNLEINSENRSVIKRGKEIELTKTEFDLLSFMAQHKGQVLSREQLCTSVWSDEFVSDDRIIITHIHRLRTKIEDNLSDPEYILTVRGDGYKFAGN